MELGGVVRGGVGLLVLLFVMVGVVEEEFVDAVDTVGVGVGG